MPAVVRLQFVLGRGISSRAIAWFSAGHFSHVDTVLPDGRLLGSRSDTIKEPDGSETPPGVEVRQAGYAAKDWVQRVVMELTVADGNKARSYYNYLFDELGKPYDKTAIWGFAAGRDWRSADSWYCSELAMAMLEKAGIVPLVYSPSNKITPVSLACIFSALGGVVIPCPPLSTQPKSSLSLKAIHNSITSSNAQRAG